MEALEKAFSCLVVDYKLCVKIYAFERLQSMCCGVTERLSTKLDITKQLVSQIFAMAADEGIWSGRLSASQQLFAADDNV